MTKRRRNFLTGEWEEVPLETDGRRTVIARVGPPPERKTGNVWRNGWRSWSAACHPKQAKSFTEHAHELGNHDVHYDPKNGQLVSTSRAGRARELARRGFQDADGGYVETKYGKLIEN